MKVISKGYHNKSTPTLQTLTNIHHSTISSKPKQTSKLKTVKQILSQNVQILGMKTEGNAHQQNNHTESQPKTQRVHLNQLSHIRLKVINSPASCTPSVKMINSVHYKNYPNTTDRISSSSQKIQSTLNYGKLREISNFISSSVLTNTSENLNRLNVSSKEEQHSKQKQAYFHQPNKENQSKRINYYKNSKICHKSEKVIKKYWNLSNFRIGKKIGKGRFGSVYMVQEKESGGIFALKKIDLMQVKQQQMETQIIEEIKLQMFMNYPNVLKLYGFFKEENFLCLILEYAEGKCLFQKLNKKIQEKQASYYTLQMIKALTYCHSQSILHRDLKPENILLCFGVAKLADFGWAAYAPKYKRTTFCGTLDYVPPEIIRGNHYDEKVDIWSLGVLIYEMAIGYAPFETHPYDPSLTEQMTMRRILDCDLKIPTNISSGLKNLIESILSTDPQRRPSLQQIQNSSWMQKYKEQGMQIDKIVWDFWTDIVNR